MTSLAEPAHWTHSLHVSNLRIRALRAHLELPLRWHDLSVGAADLDAGVYAGLQVGLHDVAANGGAAAHGAVVGALGSREPARRPACKAERVSRTQGCPHHVGSVYCTVCACLLFVRPLELLMPCAGATTEGAPLGSRGVCRTHPAATWLWSCAACTPARCRTRAPRP